MSAGPRRELFDCAEAIVRVHGGLVLLELVGPAGRTLLVGVEPKAADALGKSLCGASLKAVGEQINVWRWGAA